MAAFGAFILCALIWGSTWYAIEFQLGFVPPEWSVVYRFGLAAVGLQLWCWFRGTIIKPDLSGHLMAAATGLLLFGLNYILVYKGTQYLTSGLVAVVFSMLSLLNVLNARLFLKTPIQLPILGAAVFGVGGLALLFRDEVSEWSFENASVYGLVLCLSATIVASLGNTTAASPIAKRYPIVPYTALALIYSTFGNTLYALAVGNPPSFEVTADYIVSLLYLAVFGTVVAFTLYLWLIEATGIAVAGYTAVVIPLVALVISTLFEGFAWTPSAIGGLALIIVGNTLMIRFNSASQKRQVKAQKPVP